MKFLSFLIEIRACQFVGRTPWPDDVPSIALAFTHMRHGDGVSDRAYAETSTFARRSRQSDASSPAFFRQSASKRWLLASLVKLTERAGGKRAGFVGVGDNRGARLPPTKKQSVPVVVRVAYTRDIEN
jgi:hypothetical protein